MNEDHLVQIFYALTDEDNLNCKKHFYSVSTMS